MTSFKKAGTATALAVPVALAVVAGIPSGPSVSALAGKMFGLIPSTLTPTSPPPLIPGFPTPIPVVFTGVTQDNLELDAASLSVPGYTVDVF